MKEPWRFVVAVCTVLLASAEVGVGSKPDGSTGITFLHLRATADGFEPLRPKPSTAHCEPGAMILRSLGCMWKFTVSTIAFFFEMFIPSRR